MSQHSRMLYRELRSSQRSYYRNGVSTNRYGKTDNRTGNQTGNRRNTLAETKTHRKGNTVMVMSTSGWQESQEALQRDLEVGSGTTSHTAGSGVRSPPKGIMKTEEVRIQSSPNNTPGGSTADSFEMVSFEKERH